MSTQPSKSTGKIARSAGAVGGAVMCSRVLGLIREQIFAGMFGAGYAYDAFVVAFRIPNLLRDLFGEGALSAAFVTVFTDYDSNKGKEATWKLASNVLVFFALIISVLTLVGIYFAQPIVNLLAPDFKHVIGKTELTTNLTRIMLPFLFFVSLAAVVMGILNTKGKFFVPALSSSFFNAGSIIGGVSLAFLFSRTGQEPITGMAWGTLIGGCLQLCMQFPSLKRVGFIFRPRLFLTDPGLKRILLLMLPATIGLSATQINIFINTNFAASCVEGSVSWLNYAFRLVQLPIGVFGVALSVAVMPILARQAAQKDTDSLKLTLTSSLVMVFTLAIPATAGLIILAEPIIRLIFERGAFNAVDTVQTAQALSYYALGLFAYSSIKVMVPAFYAIGNTRYPVIGSFLAVVANIIIINLTIDLFQHRAIALSTSCTMAINFIFLGCILYKKLQGFPLGHLFIGVGKVVLASLVMSAGLLVLKGQVESWLHGVLLLQITGVFSLIGSGCLLYFLSLHVLKLPEMRTLTDKLSQRWRRS